MVKDGIHDYADPAFMCHLHKAAEVLVGSEAPVNSLIVPAVISVGGGFEDRSDVNGVASQDLEIRDSGRELGKAAADRSGVISLLRPHHAQRIDVIEYCGIVPCHRRPSIRENYRRLTKPSIRSRAFFRS